MADLTDSPTAPLGTATDPDPAPLGTATDALLARLAALPSLVVAFSGGVDSTVVLAAARRALPAGTVLAVIADSPSLARTELAGARETATGVGVDMITVGTGELAVDGYRRNTGDRCYFCKSTVLTSIIEVAARYGIRHVATGTHLDDRRAAHRPGLRAATELGVLEPLVDSGFTKTMVRELAGRWGLPVADKPGSPCLASRVAVGIPVSAPRLRLVEHAEDLTRRLLAARGIVVRDLRVRLLGTGYRVELDTDAHEALHAGGLWPRLEAALAGLGVRGPGTVVTYRCGSVSL